MIDLNKTYHDQAIEVGKTTISAHGVRLTGKGSQGRGSGGQSDENSKMLL
jgi:hypothetical protein